MKKIVLLLGIGALASYTQAQSIYNYIGSGPLDALTSWTLMNSNGTNPLDFTSDNQIFVLTNVPSTTLASTDWTVSGNGSEIQIGDGSTSTNLSVASNATLMVNGGAKLRIRNRGNLKLYTALENLPASSDVIAENGSTIEWNQTTRLDIWPIAYSNMILNPPGKNVPPNKEVIISTSIKTNAYLQLLGGSTLTILGDPNGNLAIESYNSNSILNIGGTSTNSINVVFFNSTNVTFGGILLNRNARVKFSPNATILTFSGKGSSITTGTLDLSSVNTFQWGGPLTFGAFGGAYVTGSPSLTLEINNAGAISGSILFEQTNANTRAVKVLNLNKSGQTLTLGNPLDVYSSVDITAGTLASGGNLTLKSNASQKARISALGTSADVTGDVRVETFAKGGSTGWTNLAVAGVSGQTMASGWGDNFPMTCPSACPNGSTAGGSPFTSVTTYDETNDSYPGISSGLDPITPGVGYWVYLGNGQYTTTDILIDVTGPIVKKAAGSWNFTKGQGGGWNLVGNPYPSPISFAKAFGGSYSGSVPKMANELRVWNPDLNSGNGDYALYKVGVGSTPSVSLGGIDDNIPTGQAFYILANQNFSVAWNESHKTTAASTNPLLKTINGSDLLSSTPQQNRLFYLNLTGTGANAYAGIHFNANATLSYHPDYDAIQLDPYPGAPQIFSVVGDKELKVKGLPFPNGTISVDIKVRSGTSGTYQIALQGVNNIPAGTCISLFDKFTNTAHNLLASPYSFNFSDTTTVARFTLHVTMNTLPNITTNIVNTPLCHNQNTGIIAASMTSGNYTFVWKDVNNQIIRTVSGLSKDSLKNVGEGYYFVEVSDGNCSNITTTVQLVAHTSVPTIDFTTNADTLPVNTPFIFSNNSQNLSTFKWNFDDGDTATTMNASHSYTTPGNYLVVLNGMNACGDTLVMFKELMVMAPTGLNPNGVPLSPSIHISRDSKGYFITANYTKDTKVNVLVSDLLGRTLIQETVVLGNNRRFYLNNLPSQQIVVIRTEDGYNLMNKKIYVEE